MAVDSSIYGMLRGPAAMPDPVEQYGKALTLRTMMGQQSLQGLQEDELRRGIGEKRALRDLFAKNPRATVEEVGAIDPEYALKYGKARQEEKKLGLETQETEGKVINQRLAFFRDRIPADPQGAAQWLQAQYSDPVLAPHLMKAGPLETALAQIPTDPQAFNQWRTAEALGMKAFMEKNVPSVSTRNLGGTTETISVAPLTGDVRTLSTSTNTQSPDSTASIAAQAEQGRLNRGVTVRGQDLTNARAQDTLTAGRAPAGYRFAADGRTLEAIPGGPATSANTASEDERRSAGLAVRMEAALRLVNEVTNKKTGDPNAAKPGILSEAMRGMPLIGGDTPANVVTGAARQRVETAQLDALDAALTLATGAAYTKEQLRGLARSYFPQIGDEDQVVLDKKKRLQDVIETARIRAGRAGGNVDRVLNRGGASGGWTIEEVK